MAAAQHGVGGSRLFVERFQLLADVVEFPREQNFLPDAIGIAPSAEACSR